MSGLSLLQEMTEGLASYPNAGVWRPVPSPLESLDAELLVEIRQDQSEFWSSQPPLFFPDFRHGGSMEPSQELCSSQCCLSSLRAVLTSAYYCFSKLTKSCSFSSSKLLGGLVFFPMFDWLWPFTPFELGWNIRTNIFLPPCCGYSIVPSPSSLFCTCWNFFII